MFIKKYQQKENNIPRFLKYIKLLVDNKKTCANIILVSFKTTRNKKK